MNIVWEGSHEQHEERSIRRKEISNWCVDYQVSNHMTCVGKLQMQDLNTTPNNSKDIVS